MPWRSTEKQCAEQLHPDGLLLIFWASRTHASQETLFQVRVSEKTNEIPVAQEVLPCLALPGRVYTADALHTQRAFTQVVVDLRGYSLLTVKENHPTLYADLQTYFSDSEASYEQAQTSDRHKGRLEVRQIRVTTSMNASSFVLARVSTSGTTEAQRHDCRETQRRSSLSHHKSATGARYS
jgi:predicted transposase YbfD/YdcC